MHIFGFSLPTILPTLFSIILLCVRVRSRMIVPLLSIIYNFALYDLMAKQLFVEKPAFKIPFKFTEYPYVCVLALFIGLLVEIIIRATVKWGRNKMRNTDAPLVTGGISMTDILTLYVVFSSFIGFLAPHMISSLVLLSAVLLAALQLKDLKPRWITLSLWIYGCYLIEGICLSLICTQSFQRFAGFEVPFELFKRLDAWQSLVCVLANLVFGVALYVLCRTIKTQNLTSEGVVEEIHSYFRSLYERKKSHANKEASDC